MEVREHGHGTFCFFELNTPDQEAAKRFYGGLFGWSVKEIRVPNGDYTIFGIEGRPVAGLMAIGPDWGPVTPHWQVYFAVESCDAGVATAERLGGSRVFGPSDVPGAGRFAVLADPSGAPFAIMRPEDPPVST